MQDGDPLTFIDLDGIMLLAPRVGLVPKLAAEIEAQAKKAGVSTDELIAGVREDRRGAGRGR